MLSCINCKVLAVYLKICRTCLFHRSLKRNSLVYINGSCAMARISTGLWRNSVVQRGRTQFVVCPEGAACQLVGVIETSTAEPGNIMTNTLITVRLYISVRYYPPYPLVFYISMVKIAQSVVFESLCVTCCYDIKIEP